MEKAQDIWDSFIQGTAYVSITPSQLLICKLHFSFAPTPCCSNDDYHQIKGLHRNIAQTQTPAFAATLPYMQCNHRHVQITKVITNQKCSNPFCVLTLNRIDVKSMLKNKSPQITRGSVSSYVGYLRDERIIAHVIVERVPNMKCKHQKQLTTT